MTHQPTPPSPAPEPRSPRTQDLRDARSELVQMMRSTKRILRSLDCERKEMAIHYHNCRRGVETINAILAGKPLCNHLERDE